MAVFTPLSTAFVPVDLSQLQAMRESRGALSVANSFRASQTNNAYVLG